MLFEFELNAMLESTRKAPMLFNLDHAITIEPISTTRMNDDMVTVPVEATKITMINGESYILRHTYEQIRDAIRHRRGVRDNGSK
ncbi:hypothetical protein D3C76_692190 [compost metagenome]